MSVAFSVCQIASLPATRADHLLPWIITQHTPHRNQNSSKPLLTIVNIVTLGAHEVVF
jgi:hypothetical protein